MSKFLIYHLLNLNGTAVHSDFHGLSGNGNLWQAIVMADGDLVHLERTLVSVWIELLDLTQLVRSNLSRRPLFCRKATTSNRTTDRIQRNEGKHQCFVHHCFFKRCLFNVAWFDSI